MDLADALLMGIVWSFLNPLVFVPAIVVGWLARDVRLVIVGALAMAAISIGMSLSQPLPPGARIVYAGLATQLIAPLAIALATFKFERWLHESAGPASPQAGRRIARTILGAMLGGITGALAFGTIGLLALQFSGVGNDDYVEGATMMILGSLVGLLIGLVVGAVLGWKRPGRIITLPEHPH
jgi:hypothetical protein